MSSPSDSDPFQIYVGPHACPEHYEIKTDILQDFSHAQIIREPNSDIIYLDLIATLKEELNTKKINYQLTTSEICTITDNRYYSYRQDRQETGRNLLVLVIFDHLKKKLVI